MDKALFLGLSAAFFMAYSLVAAALFNSPADQITPISSPIPSEEEHCEGFPTNYHDFLICSGWGDVPIAGGIFEGIDDFITLAGNLFGTFFQLITFQVPGAVAASTVTFLIFIPLTFINGFIIFSAIRGSS
jgi:hypothetical protein